MSDHDKWLALVDEETIEPELPICDPHHHLWDVRRDGDRSRYLLDELLADTGSGHNVVATVFIECGAMYRSNGPEHLRPVGETEFVNGIAAMSASGTYGPTRVAAGIVGMANLLLGAAVEPVLEAHIAAGGGRFRGIRHAASWDADPDIRNAHVAPDKDMLAEESFREGVRLLARHNLSFEGWLYHPQIPELTALARACPETTIILNHFGGPLGIGSYAGKREEIFAQWRDDIAALAECDNVIAKLGGINMKLNGFGWHKREKPPSSEALAVATRPWYEHCIETFSPRRCMFESNFPVDRTSCSYNVLWNCFKRIAEGCSAGEKAALFHDTAARVYRVQD